MIVDINGVPHHFWRGKLYPGGTTPPHHPRDGAPRVIANRIDGGCDYLPDPDWVPPATTPASPPLPPEVLQAIAELNQKERFGPPMYSGGPTYRRGRGRETSHFLTSPLSPEQQHLNMINHLKGLHGPRGSQTP